MTYSPVRLALTAIAAMALLGACSGPAATPASAPSSVTPSSDGSVGPSTPAPSGPGSSGSPAPSTGSIGQGRIVFARYIPTTGFYELFTIKPDGSDLKELLPKWTYTLDTPRWSWEGNLILARTNTPTIIPADAVHHIHLETTASVSLTCSAWSPDDKTIACDGADPAKAGREGIYTVPSKTSELVPWTHERIDIGTPVRITTAGKGTHDIPGDYSADGRIVFVRTTYAVLGLGEIWTAKADGSDAQKLTDTLSTYRVAWSHDGRWIVGEREGVLELFDLTDLTRDPARLTIPGGKATEPRFSPDGRRIVFVYTKAGAGTTSIESVALDGSGVVQITSGEVDRSPDWGTPGF